MKAYPILEKTTLATESKREQHIKRGERRKREKQRLEE